MWLSCDCRVMSCGYHVTVFFSDTHSTQWEDPRVAKQSKQAVSLWYLYLIFLTSLSLSFCLCLSLLSLLFSSSLSYLQKMTYDRNYKMKYDNFQKSLAQKRPVSIQSLFSHLSSFIINLCVSLLLPFFILSCLPLLSLSLSLFLSFSFSSQEGLPRQVEIPVRRDHLFEDSHRKIMTIKNKDHLKARLYIKFPNETGLDYGGLAR